MTPDTVQNIERSLHKTNKWIKDVKDEIEMSADDAYLALKETLHMIRDRLTIDEATDIAAQLPLILQGAFYDGWKPASKPEKMSKSAFVSRVQAKFDNNPDIVPDALVGGVLRVLQRKVSEGEIEDVKGCLPKQIKELFEETSE